MTTVLHASQPTQAGVANVVLALVTDQVSRGWDVHVAAPDDGYLLEHARAAGASTHVWRTRRSPGASVVSETRALRSVLAAVDPDVVHLHSAKAGLAGRLALRGARPTIFMPHAWSFEAVTGPVASASRMWEMLAARWTTLTLCVSEAERALGEHTGVLGQRVAVVPNGVDCETWRPGDRTQARRELGIDESPTVVCVGRLSRQKGQDVLLDAWPAVRAAIDGARLYLVGDGPERKRLETLLCPGATLVGPDAARRWLDAADVVALPSRWEGMPLVLLEAMACGRAIVATDVNGISEALGSRETLVDPDTPTALSGGLIRLLTDDALRTQIGEANRQRAVTDLEIRRTTRDIADLTASIARR